MSEKQIYLPPSFDSEKYLQERLNKVEAELAPRIENDFAGFGGMGQFGGPSGMSPVNPFNLPGSAMGGSGQMLSNANTIFDNLRWYYLSNFRQVLSQAYVEIGLVSTIVDIPVDDAFRGGVDISTKQLSPEQVEQLQVSLDRDDDLNTVAQAAKWNRLFGGAGVLILTDQDPRKPLDLEAITEDSPFEVRAIDMWEMFFDKQSTDGFDPSIQTRESDYYDYYGQIIHKSRVLRMKGQTAPSFVRPRLRGWGFSIVEQLVRSINQFLKSQDLAFNLLDQYKVDIFRLKNLTNTLLSPQGANKVRQRVAVANQIKSFQAAIVLDSEDQYDQKTMSWTGFAEIMKELRMQIASDMRMPLTKLFGLSASGLNSGEDDIENYNATVESGVRNKVKYMVLRVIEIKCQRLFGMIPSDLAIAFKPLRIMSGVDEEAIKTSKFNRLLQARQANEITTEQFVDACNRGKLFDIALEKVDMLGGNDADDAGEDVDPEDSNDSDDPGTARADTKKPKAGDKGGAPKGQVKQTPPPSDSKSEDEEEESDEVKNPKNPGGNPKTTPAPKMATNPSADDEEDDEQRRPMKKAEWRDEKTPEQEMEDHDVKLEKPKKARGDAPDPKKAEAKKPKTAEAKNPKTADAKKPKNSVGERRINNVGRLKDKCVRERLKIGITPALKDKATGEVLKGRWDELHADIIARDQGADLSDYHKGFIYKGRFIFEQEANMLTQKLWEDGQLNNEELGPKRNEADLIQHPNPFFQTPDDKSLDSQRGGHPNVPSKYVAVVGCVTKDKKWILTGQRRDTGLWVFPGGRVEPGEEWVEAACRELQEETGIEISIKTMQQSLLTQKKFKYADHKTTVRAYCVELPDRIMATTTEDPDMEVSKWRWVPLNKNTQELQSFNRHAPEDIIVDALLKPKYRSAE